MGKAKPTVETKNLLDRIKNQLLNHPLVAWGLIVIALLTGAANLTGTIDTLISRFVIVAPVSPELDPIYIEAEKKYFVDVDERKASELYFTLAKRGHLLAGGAVARLLWLGRGVKKDREEAIEWANKSISGLRKLSESNNVVASYLLGRILQEGIGVAPDINNAVILYKSAARGGYGPAQSSIAGLYQNGTGVPQDYAEALFWYQKAAEQSNAFAQIELGKMYEYGEGVKKDEAVALAWYRKAAEQNDPSGQYLLGRMYEEGRGTKLDFVEAMVWYRKSSEGGDTSGQVSMGRMYELGRGAKKDEVEALEWYRKAAQAGDSEGQNRLGVMYEYARGVKEDYHEAINWYRASAEQGDSTGLYYLGTMYEDGKGTPLNETEAASLYRKSAEKNNIYGQTDLGRFYEYGIGVTKDYAEALVWYRKAAEQGYSDALYRLGGMYEFGNGVAMNYRKALELYREAAENGHEKAQVRIGEVLVNDGQFEQAELHFRNLISEGDERGYIGLCSLFLTRRANDAEIQQGISLCESHEKVNVVGANLKLANFYKRSSTPSHYKSISKAIFHYEKVIAASNDKSEQSCPHYYIGKFYNDGVGVKQNTKLAIEHLELAASGSSWGAYYELALIYEKSKAPYLNLEKSLRYYEVAAQNNVSQAHLALSSKYKYGDGVDQDPLKSARHLQQAAELGDEVAIDQITSAFRPTSNSCQTDTYAKR